MRELLCYSVTLSCSCYHGYSLPVYLWLQTCAVHTVKRVAYVLHQKHCPINSKTNVDSGSIRHYQLSASFSHHIILTVLYFTFFYDLFTKLNPNPAIISTFLSKPEPEPLTDKGCIQGYFSRVHLQHSNCWQWVERLLDIWWHTYVWNR